jgi:hypothetical protein
LRLKEPGNRKMNKSLDFVFVRMPVERAEGEWCDFLMTRKEVPGSHQIAFIPAIAGSFLVSNEIRYSGLVPALRRRWTERGASTARLLLDFQNGQRVSFPLGDSIHQIPRSGNGDKFVLKGPAHQASP